MGSFEAEPTPASAVAVFALSVAASVAAYIVWFHRRNGTGEENQECHRGTEDGENDTHDGVVKSFAEVPGVDPSDPQLGNLGDLARFGSLHEFLMHLHHHKFRSDVVSFWWMSERVVSIASPSTFRETEKLRNRPVNLFSLFEPLIGKMSIQYANDEDFDRRQKTYLDRPFSHDNLKRMYGTFKHVMNEKLQQWASKATDITIEDEGVTRPTVTVNLQEEMFSIAMKTVALSSFGECMTNDDIREVAKAYNICWGDMESRMDGSFPNSGSKREKDFKASVEMMHSLARRFARKKNDDKPNEGASRGYESIIDYMGNRKDGIMPKEQLEAEIVTFLVGGFHTTGNMLTWAVYFLLKHPTVMERARDEVRSVLGGEKKMPDFEDVPKMHYLNQILSETLRVSVLAPWAARYSDDDLPVGGFLIPAKTPIIQALGVVLQDRENWHEPEHFDPDRFSTSNFPNLDRLAFTPFGFAGNRRCPAYRYANVESVFVLSTMIQCVDMKLRDTSLKATPVYGLVTHPKEDIMVRLTPPIIVF